MNKKIEIVMLASNNEGNSLSAALKSTTELVFMSVLTGISVGCAGGLIWDCLDEYYKKKKGENHEK